MKLLISHIQLSFLDNSQKNNAHIWSTVICNVINKLFDIAKKNIMSSLAMPSNAMTKFSVAATPIWFFWRQINLEN